MRPTGNRSINAHYHRGMTRAKWASLCIGACSAFRPSIRNGQLWASVIVLSSIVCCRRFWWEWKGYLPKQNVLEFMKKNYPADWSYVNFAPELRAELFGRLT
jgi:hypothetical protein